MNDINAAQRLRLAAVEKAEASKVKVVKEAEAEAEAKYLQGAGVARQRQVMVLLGKLYCRGQRGTAVVCSSENGMYVWLSAQCCDDSTKILLSHYTLYYAALSGSPLACLALACCCVSSVCVVMPSIVSCVLGYLDMPRLYSYWTNNWWRPEVRVFTQVWACVCLLLPASKHGLCIQPSRTVLCLSNCWPLYFKLAGHCGWAAAVSSGLQGVSDRRGCA
jgi:hypothetical protein